MCRKPVTCLFMLRAGAQHQCTTTTPRSEFESSLHQRIRSIWEGSILHFIHQSVNMNRDYPKHKWTHFNYSSYILWIQSKHTALSTVNLLSWPEPAVLCHLNRNIENGEICSLSASHNASVNVETSFEPLVSQWRKRNTQKCWWFQHHGQLRTRSSDWSRAAEATLHNTIMYKTTKENKKKHLYLVVLSANGGTGKPFT